MEVLKGNRYAGFTVTYENREICENQRQNLSVKEGLGSVLVVKNFMNETDDTFYTDSFNILSADSL